MLRGRIGLRCYERRRIGVIEEGDKKKYICTSGKGVVVSCVSKENRIPSMFRGCLSTMISYLKKLKLGTRGSKHGSVLVKKEGIDKGTFRRLPSEDVIRKALLCSASLRTLARTVGPPLRGLRERNIRSIEREIRGLGPFLGPRYKVRRIRRRVVRCFYSNEVDLARRGVGRVRRVRSRCRYCVGLAWCRKEGSPWSLSL